MGDAVVLASGCNPAQYLSSSGPLVPSYLCSKQPTRLTRVPPPHHPWRSVLFFSSLVLVGFGLPKFVKQPLAKGKAKVKGWFVRRPAPPKLQPPAAPAAAEAQAEGEAKADAPSS